MLTARSANPAESIETRLAPCLACHGAQGRSDSPLVPSLGGHDGQPLASPELVVIISLPRQSDGQPANVPLRGVGPKAFEVRATLKMVEGRRFTPGLREIIVGRLATGLAGILVTIWCGLRGWPRDVQRTVFQPVGVAIFAMSAAWLGVSGAVGFDVSPLIASNAVRVSTRSTVSTVPSL